MKYPRLNLLIISISFMFSCQMEKDIDYDVLYGGDKIVVHGFLNPDGIFLYVKKTVPQLDGFSDNFIKGANVTLYEDNNILGTLEEIENGFFVSSPDFIPLKNSAYHIEINGEGVKTAVSSAQYLPFDVNIDTIYFTEKNPESIYKQLLFSFTDPVGSDNYYSYKYFLFTGGENLSKTYHQKFIPYSVYPDEEFAGEKRSEIFDFFAREYSSAGHKYVDSVRVILYSFSPDYYEFSVSEDDYESTNSSAYYEQPVPMFSNIENGYGIFAAYTVDSITISVTQ